MIFPPPLKPGGTVLLAAPSSPLAESQPVEAIAGAVEALGYRVRVGASCRGTSPCGYAAAPPLTPSGASGAAAPPGSCPGCWIPA